MYRLIEIIAILALATAGGLVLSQGGYGTAAVVFVAAIVLAIATDNRQEAEYGK